LYVHTYIVRSSGVSADKTFHSGLCIRFIGSLILVQHKFPFPYFLITSHQNYPHNWKPNQACTLAFASISGIWPVSDLKIIYLWQSAAEHEWHLCFISLNTARQINKSWC